MSIPENLDKMYHLYFHNSLEIKYTEICLFHKVFLYLQRNSPCVSSCIFGIHDPCFCNTELLCGSLNLLYGLHIGYILESPSWNILLFMLF